MSDPIVTWAPGHPIGASATLAVERV